MAKEGTEQALPSATSIDISSWRRTKALWGVVWEVLTQRKAARKLGPASWACHESIKGKTVIITGPTSGIGLETARELVVAGAHVVLACRRPEVGEELLQEWRKKISQVNAEVMELDLSSLQSVKEFAERWGNRPVHVLINNAGVFSMGGKQRMTMDGLEEHVQVNFLSPLLLTLLLLPALKRAQGARVVNLSSRMHELASLDVRDLSFTSARRKYTSTGAYCQSKLAQLLITNYLHRQLPGSAGINIVAVHPGEVLTNVARSLPSWLMALQRLLLPSILLTPSHGARGPLFCATHPSVQQYAETVRKLQQKGGPYYSFDCCPITVGDQAKNEDVGKQLWGVCLEILELPPDFVESQVR